jgi:hypothetical protein
VGGGVLSIQGAANVQKINLFQLQQIIILIKYVKEVKKGQINNFCTFFLLKSYEQNKIPLMQRI